MDLERGKDLQEETEGAEDELILKVASLTGKAYGCGVDFALK